MEVEEKLKKTAKRLGITVEQMPHHIAIIMDGNGRWAMARGSAANRGTSPGRQNR